MTHHPMISHESQKQNITTERIKIQSLAWVAGSDDEFDVGDILIKIP
jgi:hypothetical protein